jgi:hypothetical protein
MLGAPGAAMTDPLEFSGARRRYALDGEPEPQPVAIAKFDLASA